MTKMVFPMPPVAYFTTYLSPPRFPVAVSVGAYDGVEDRSPFGPPRRQISVSVSALSKRRDSAGLMHSLARLLAGVHFVRINTPPVNWHRDALENGLAGGLQTYPVQWQQEGDPVEWQNGDGDPVTWFLNGPFVGAPVTVQGFPAINVTDLPPGRLIVRAGDFVRSLSGTGATLGVSQAINTIYARADGTATVPLFDALPAGIISFGDVDSIVCRMTGYTDAPQGIGANFYPGADFTEALPEEYAGAEEVDPWSIA
jgi:hypothetical protein